MTRTPRRTLLRRARYATLGIVAAAVAGTGGLAAVAAASDGGTSSLGDHRQGDLGTDSGGTGVVPPSQSQTDQQTQGESHAS